mgnify:CR=1 FL=1
MFDVITTWFSTAAQNYGAYVGLATGIVLVFERLAKLTPTTKDDSIVNWIYKVFAILGVKVPELEQNSKGEIIVAK